jgi:hypothetical protein
MAADRRALRVMTATQDAIAAVTAIAWAPVSALSFQ